jgi:beta-glucosidase
MPEITVEHFSARWHGSIEARTSGRHLVYSRSHDSVYRVVLDGKTLIDTWPGERNGLHTFEVTLEAGRTYSIEILWRKTRYWGGMQLGWECIENRGQEVARCVELAEQASLALVCVGFDNVSEGEGFDRRFAMHEELERLVLEVSRAQPNTVVVLTAGGNVDMRPWLDGVRGLLFASYPGQEGGQAVAEILFGKVNPSGKLPATFEKRLEDRSSYCSYHDDDGDLRVQLTDGIFTGYRHVDRTGIEPQFSFGFGLSFTTFIYENLELSKTRLALGETVTVSIDVVNVGAREGSEVVQIYVRDVEASVPRPNKELKGFAKVSLAPGERRRVTVELDARAFAFYDVARRDWVVEPGSFEVLVGASSTDIRANTRLEIGECRQVL